MEEQLKEMIDKCDDAAISALYLYMTASKEKQIIIEMMVFLMNKLQECTT